MVNLHIGGAVSVFLICVSLLACDHWFNRGEPNIQLSETYDNSKTPAELVSVPSGRFFFAQEPSTDKHDAGWRPRQSWAEKADAWTENFQPEKLAPDGNFFSSGIQNN